MSFLKNFAEFATEAIHRRLAIDEITKKKTLIEHGTLAVVLRPLDSEDFALTEGDFSRQFKVYAEISADLAEGDELEIDSEIYRVKSVNKFTGAAEVEHLLAVVEKVRND